jgi:serine/threonine protein kinase
MNIQQTICPNCSHIVDPDAPGGICPECLLAAAVSQPAEADTLPRSGLFQAPDPADLSRAIASLDVQELLGHGGMGAVYRARQVNLDRPVALKILAPQLSEDPGFSERFAREARTLARLNHPNIVTVYDFGRAGEYCYLVMELIDGVNLREAIATGGLSPQQALSIIPRICDALQYAHDQGGVHRDIKPENILVGLQGQVKIADFGLAKLLDSADTNFTLTATRQVLGTRNYMAPEQIERPAAVDHRADIYSLGVVFYELLTGELPLGRFSRPREKSSVNRDLDEVVLRTLEKEPDRRYQQASEFRTAVESIDLSKESPLQSVNGLPSLEKPAASAVPQAGGLRTGAEGAAAAAPSRGTPGRRWSLPFYNDQVHGGLSRLNGMAHLNANTLDIEFRVHQLHLSRSAKRTVSIPYSQLVNVLLSHGMLSSTLEIQGASLETFDEIPGSAQGRLPMSVEKSDGPLAEDFCSQLRTRLEAASPADYRESDSEAAAALAHLPFLISEVHGGFSEAIGIAKVTPANLVVEYEIRDAFGVVKSAPRKAMVPFAEIVSLAFRRGMIRDVIEVQTSTIENVASIPNSSQGKFKIRINKRDRPMALAFMRQAHRQAGIPVPPEVAESKSLIAGDPVVELQEQLLPFRIGTLVMVLINIVALTIVLMLLLAGSENTIAKVTSNVGRLLPFTPDRLQLLALLAAGPMVMTFAGVLLWWLLSRLQGYYLALVLVVLIALPVHPGVVVGLPLAGGLLLVLGQRVNRQAYRGRQRDFASS